MNGKYLGLLIFAVLIVVGIIVLIYFKIRWDVVANAQQRRKAKKIEETDKSKQKNQ